MTDGTGYSLSDIVSATRSGDGMFGNGGILFALLFLIIIMGNGAWGGNRGLGIEAIQNQMQQGCDNQNNMANQREIVGATNQVYHDLVGYVGDKYAELDRDILGISSSIQNVIANQNQCCCNTLRAIDSVKFENAQNTAAINAVSTANAQKILDAISQNKIDAMQNRINQLELAQATAGVVKYPTEFAYSAGASPFCGGCGCGF